MIFPRKIQSPSMIQWSHTRALVCSAVENLSVKVGYDQPLGLEMFILHIVLTPHYSQLTVYDSQFTYRLISQCYNESSILY